jgi:hypothetical protein
MHAFSSPRLARAAIGLAAVCAFAVAPMAAQAANTTGPTGTDTSGQVSAGDLTFSAPALGSFDTTLTGVSQTAHATVGDWNITDARGSHAGYSVMVKASVPTVGTAGATLPDGSITITPTKASATDGNTGTTAPVTGAGTTQASTPPGVNLIAGTATAIDNATTNTGEGSWAFTGDSGDVKSLAVVIPSDTTAGTYGSTLTFTAAAKVQ